MCFGAQSFLILIKSRLSFSFNCLFLWCHWMTVSSKKPLSIQCNEPCLVFSSKSLYSFFNSYVYFDPFLSHFCIWCKIRDWLHSFACAYPVFLAPLGKIMVSLLKVLAPLSRIIWLYLRGFISGDCSLPLICMSVFMPLLPCFNYYGFVLQSGSMSPSSFFFFFKIIWQYLGSTKIPYEF